LSLSPISCDVQLLNDIGRGVSRDDERLSSVVAFGISTVITISHTSKSIEDETRGRVEGSIVLSDARSAIAVSSNVPSGSSTNKRHTKSLSLSHHAVMSFDDSGSLV